ncbi:MAG TPA: carboxymuconolactone decarboxylase family protein [Streptomyces sp.]|uniref:carboxymuconolactone decarboxylase family protein n=1 Tax=Streptomyces sp. TaxID=1931 RepID=UPI002D295D06|nr:carboxymuconolactone decarboxylase family protein [Streptomyces sp.]HZG03073.1 carboxymuconolactone decarboxylase family protein [Streptomyces sp.]
MDLDRTAPEAYQGFLQTDAALRRGPLDATVRELVKIRASQLNGCVFCVDLHTREARRLGERQDRLDQLVVWQESELFDERERAALAYTEAVTRREHVGDELWETLRKHFPEAELGNLVAQVALINALNLLGVPLRKKPPVRESQAPGR